MRRVYDDSMYDAMKEKIVDAIATIVPANVSEYSWGTYRAKVSKVRDYLAHKCEFKMGRNDHANGIGNNNAIEIIINAENEEQICGLLHLTDDMYGGVIVWVTDIDGKRRSTRAKISGCDRHSEYDMRYKNRVRWEG